MSNTCIIGCDEMRERGIDTSFYEYNRVPGIYKAVIDLMAESRKTKRRMFLMKSSEISFLPDSLLVCYQVMFTDYPDIVSVFQLQKMLKISRQLAYELINNGSIKAVKVGNSYRIPKVSVIGYMLNAA